MARSIAFLSCILLCCLASAYGKTALLIIDMQNDFLPPSGSLAVPDGHAALQVINRLRVEAKFDVIALSQDWHPSNHLSFVDNHADNPNAKLFEPMYVASCNCNQMMWPRHCVQNSFGSQFHVDLLRDPSDLLVQKGQNPDIDSYSAFFDNNRAAQTPLDALLKSHGVTEVFVSGLALDYCVGFTALDAISLGYKTSVIMDAARGVSPASIASMVDRLQTAGVQLIQSQSLIARSEL
jgi:nicotinamidase/pyrazinamidase